MSFKIAVDADTKQLPKRGTKQSAVFDLAAGEDVHMKPHVRYIISTKIRMAIPAGYYGQIAERSSLARNYVNVHAGVIDSDYRGYICVVMSWTPPPGCTEPHYRIYFGDRIAQLLVLPYAHQAELELTEQLDSTQRQDGGFGSTGI
jgi:dUTP pyrophosphatase